MLEDRRPVDLVGLFHVKFLGHLGVVQHLTARRVHLDAPLADAGLHVLKVEALHAVQQARLQALGGVLRGLLALGEALGLGLVALGLGLLAADDPGVGLGPVLHVTFHRVELAPDGLGLLLGLGAVQRRQQIGVAGFDFI